MQFSYLSPSLSLSLLACEHSRYMSPERLAGQPYGPPGDIWSFGILLLEMATRSLPFMQVSKSGFELDVLTQNVAVTLIIALSTCL